MRSSPRPVPRRNSLHSVANSSVTVRVPAKVNLQLSVGPLRADGYLSVDGRVIYAMKDFTVQQRGPQGS